MADEEKTIRVILAPPERQPMSKWEKAFTFAMGMFLVWEILTGPGGRRRG